MFHFGRWFLYSTPEEKKEQEQAYFQSVFPFGEQQKQLEQALLERTPLWLLQNRGDSAAAELCRDTLSKELTQL